MTRRLEELRWDNSFSRLPETFYQRVNPTPLPGARLVAFNPEAAGLLDLDPGEAGRRDFVPLLTGERGIPGTTPLAAIYAGHQFGVWVPQLGDGRAILLGEVVNSRGERWDVQLKGSGLTRFSRMGDGRAVLRSTIREYLGGEAMHGLGIPSTRSLAIIGSDEPVFRESVETGAILVRLAPTHVRFGSFEVFASRGMTEEVRLLADHVIDHHFPHLLVFPASERYGAWLREVMERTAELMARWTAVGFTHGVLNTDNMSIVGLSLDYGPYGWIDQYDRGFVPNHSDPAGRYAFDQQPIVGLWNCARLAESLQTVVTTEQAMSALDAYRGAFTRSFDDQFRAKLGLERPASDDAQLISQLLGALHDRGIDYTRFFRALALYPERGRPAFDGVVDEPGALLPWLERYDARLARDAADPVVRSRRMLQVNPAFVLRTWMAQEAIADAQDGNFATIERLRALLAEPFTEHPDLERYAGRPPEWATTIALSCSS